MSRDATAGATRPRRGSRTLPDRLLEAAGAGMVFLALALMLGENGRPEAGEMAEMPGLALRAPLGGAVVDGPLAVEFELEPVLERKPAGWGVGTYHLHLQLDELELMPGPHDLEPLGGGRYRWTVGELEPGTHRLRLFWSDERHRAVPGGESAVVEVEAR